MDTYGGYSRHGGGASGDARTVQLLCGSLHCQEHRAAAGLAKKAEGQLAYVIGVAQPVSFVSIPFGTGTVAERFEKQRQNA